ncbi:unnamed protein product [Rotaria sp. Silwood1]|nr:unnamed protein product [Rotaria sp. Silwood1]
MQRENIYNLQAKAYVDGKRFVLKNSKTSMFGDVCIDDDRCRFEAVYIKMLFYCDSIFNDIGGRFDVFDSVVEKS